VRRNFIVARCVGGNKNTAIVSVGVGRIAKMTIAFTAPSFVKNQWQCRAVLSIPDNRLTTPALSSTFFAHYSILRDERHFALRLGYKSVIWAVAHRLCRVVWKILHDGVRFIEHGREMGPREKKQRAQILARALRKLGYEVTITPLSQLAAKPAI
jgi:hypothetical protein